MGITHTQTNTQTHTHTHTHTHTQVGIVSFARRSISFFVYIEPFWTILDKGSLYRSFFFLLLSWNNVHHILRRIISNDSMAVSIDLVRVCIMLSAQTKDGRHGTFAFQ